MKAVLDTLASYAMIPHGFQRHKGRVVRLAEAALNIARSGGPSTQEIAQLFVGPTPLAQADHKFLFSLFTLLSSPAKS